jgi:hypothetical protein
VDSADYFCDPANKWLREAWIAGEFGHHRLAQRIRLASEGGWPDFEVELADGSHLKCEAIEADKLGRKRGQEWRSSKKLGYPTEQSSYEDMLADRRSIPAALTAAVQRKLEKLYPENEAGLVIYLNIGWGVWRSEIEPVIALHTRNALQRFNSVWTLWNGRLYRTWDDGHLSIETIEAPEPTLAKFPRKSLEELHSM